MKLRLLHVAELELDEAITWYSAKGAGVADRFLSEISIARANILDRPHAWHPIGQGVRRYRLGRFPYGLIYVVDADTIVILAVAHHSRRPRYWRSRLASR